jgi:hypothetical protein
MSVFVLSFLKLPKATVLLRQVSPKRIYRHGTMDSTLSCILAATRPSHASSFVQMVPEICAVEECLVF